MQLQHTATVTMLGRDFARGIGGQALPPACLAVAAEDVDADQRPVERGVGRLHQIIVGVLSILQRIQALAHRVGCQYSA